MALILRYLNFFKDIFDIIFVYIFLKFVKKIDSVESTTGYSDLQFLFFAARDGWGQGAIVEIGAYKGKSTVALALGSAAGHREKVVSIDPHEEGVKKVYSQNLSLMGVTDNIIHMAATSQQAREKFNSPVRLLFIDGLHEYGFVAHDIALWKDLVIDGGILVFHDHNWPGVAQAVWELTKDPQQFIVEGHIGCSCLVSKRYRRNPGLFAKARHFNAMKKALYFWGPENR